MVFQGTRSGVNFMVFQEQQVLSTSVYIQWGSGHGITGYNMWVCI